MEDIEVIFQNNEFSPELINQCVDAVNAGDLDIQWTVGFFEKIPRTDRFSTVVKLLSESEKAKLRGLLERIGSEELIEQFKFN